MSTETPFRPIAWALDPHQDITADCYMPRLVPFRVDVRRMAVETPKRKPRPTCPHCGAFTRNTESGAWSCSRCGASGDLA